MPNTNATSKQQKSKRKSSGRPKKAKLAPPRFSAATADRHELYQLSVQNVESEIDFVDETFETLRGRKATTLREDFCGTGNTSCEWVRRRDENHAVGLDIDAETLGWGRTNNIGTLDESQRSRVRLEERDVREPGDAAGTDIVLAMNFSYWLFMTRDELRAYFQSVCDSLGDGGIFFLDHYGGSESMVEQEEERKIDAGFTYVWDQHRYEPITGKMDCKIHFHFKDGSKLRDAFTYTWRLWTLPEIQELLIEAGFANVTVYWEGDDGDGEGNGEFTPETTGEADPAFVCYITAEKPATSTAEKAEASA